MRWYLAYRPEDGFRNFRLLDYVSTACAGHGAVHLLVDFVKLFFRRTLNMKVGCDRGCLFCVWCRVPRSTLGLRFSKLDKTRSLLSPEIFKVSSESFCEDLESNRLSICCQERYWNKMLFRAILREEFRKCTRQVKHIILKLGVGMVTLQLMMYTSFVNVPFTVCPAYGKHWILYVDELRLFLWPQCLLWYGGLPGLSHQSSSTLWIVTSSSRAQLKSWEYFWCIPFVILRWLASFLAKWWLGRMFDGVPEDPNISFGDGKNSLDHLDVEIADAHVFIHVPVLSFDSYCWVRSQDPDWISNGCSNMFSSVPDTVQIVQQSKILGCGYRTSSFFWNACDMTVWMYAKGIAKTYCFREKDPLRICRKRRLADCCQKKRWGIRMCRIPKSRVIVFDFASLFGP